MRGLRPIFLAIVLAAVCWGFWTNSQRRMETIAMQGLFSDEADALTGEHRAVVLQHLLSFKKDFGIPLEVHIRKRPPALADHNPSRMYLDVVPEVGRAYLFLPPLVRHAVGEEFVRDLEVSFRQDFASGDWRPGLISAILALRAKLAEVTR